MNPPSDPSPPPPASSPEPSLVDRLGPDRLVLLVALVGFHGLVRIAERYLPAYVEALGYGPVVVGLLASLGLAVAVGVRFVDGESDETSSGRRRHHLALVATLFGALGLLVWAGAPTLDALLGTPLSAVGWLLVGVVLLGLCHGWGPDETGSLRGRGVAFGGSVIDLDAASRTRIRTRTRTIAAALALAGGAVLATTAFSGAETVRAGFALLVAAGSTVGLVAAVALGVARTASRTDDSGSGQTKDGSEAAPLPSTALPTLEDVRETVDALPAETRWTVAGDTLVRLATAMTLPFVVLVVVDYHAVALTVGPVSLPPAAVFGPLVLAEAIGAVAGALAAPMLRPRVDRRWHLAAGLVVPAVFPLALVAAPSSVAVLAALFALVGCRTALEPVRPTESVVTQTVARVRERGRGRRRSRAAVPETLRTAIRVALVPAPLLGGVLYAIGPVAAFSLATTVGLLGVRELLRPLRDSS
ncbi:transporter [Natronoglomus mannanivorans]|uniref:Transporter n=1 Tax=Natronoglomus mannanivorans TaxID=2979990 RepID=A0AAP2YYJ8_9EURY|nr:transporter [Halobacteria archaeon AArc-xg1-1]